MSADPLRRVLFVAPPSSQLQTGWLAEWLRGCLALDVDIPRHVDRRRRVVSGADVTDVWQALIVQPAQGVLVSLNHQPTWNVTAVK